MRRDPNRPADRVVFWTCSCLTLVLIFTQSYQYGYDTARAECKPIKTEVKPMTHRQQVRAVQWAMRDKGAIR